MIFKSKVDIWMGAIFIAVPLAMIYGVITEPDAILMLITALIIVLFATLFFGTKYIIEDKVLIIYGGIFKKRIPIEQIRSLRPSKNPFSAPALSLDRIEITFDDPYSGITLVSPKDKEAFVKKLLEVNPNIKLVS
ncbi:PH domain-containing protein [Solibacillus silvestris]|uniref:PH domain-containing protein n=1 Tax=Solibacillus silvestris TaxID=76853 RepID=UPI003F7F033D